ncbi:MAG TPA: S53 family peptidase [Bryobacteraceae bacterium]|jgi:hypothetical protein|nr:S53 family peptidase [Bryobacteraceae bacterium]
MHDRSARILRVLVLFLMPLATLLAQQDRIAGPVDRLRTIQLRGNIHPNARPQFDAGPVDPTMRLDHVRVILKRSAAQQAELDQLLAQQQDRSSRNYHSWLTPDEFGDRFGVSPNDAASIVSWLQSGGLAVDPISRGRNWISFSGTADQLNAALGTEIRRYRINGESHFANSSEPSIPAAMEPLVNGILGLDDFHPKASQYASNSLRPQFTGASGSHYLTPDDFATIYNLGPLYNAGYDGSGQRIVVAGQSAVDLADIRMFHSKYGLPQNDPQIMLVPGSTDPGHTGDEIEADLDIEWAGSIARKANIIYVYSTNVATAVSYAVDQNLGSVVSLSYGSCELANSQVSLISARALAQQANAQGITWLASSGDSGAAGCDPPTKTQASLGLGVSFPASLPEVTSVGGTQFDEADGAYWAAVNSSTLGSALSYIPEKGWNESDATGLAASGGGLSSTFPRPSWQVAPGVPDANFRSVPDVSLAAAGHDGYLIANGGKLFPVRGTSASTPSLAGILALVNQYQELNGVETRSGLGNINPNLYSMARSTSGVFHDVTSGNNIVACVTASPDCSNGTLGYAAGPGYDLVTGLGSVDGFNLAVNLGNQWMTPAIAGLSPGSVIAGGGNFTLAVNGTGFDSGSAIQWMGTPLPTTFISGTELLATISSALIAAPGSADITVVTSQGTSLPAALAIVAGLGATFSDPRVTTTPPSSRNCVVPPAITSFSITDTIYLFFNTAITRTNLLTADWLAPNGAVLFGDALGAQSGAFCFGNSRLSLTGVNMNPIGTWQARVFDHGNLLFSVPFTVAVSGNQTTPLAHAADGNAFKTTILLTNTGGVPAPYTLRFNDDQGNLPSMRFELETGSLTGMLPAGESVSIRTAGIGPATVNGWAELTAPASVGGSVIYSQKNPNLPSIQEGTATIGTSASQHFFLPFDNTSNAATGVAFTNPGASAANNIRVTFHYSDGSSESSSFPPLASRNHRAFALSVPGKKGVAEITSDAALLAVVFRANSTGAFTALDGVPAGIDATIVPNRPLAHVADGNAFKTTVLLTNGGAAPASYTVRFNDDQGNIPATRFELDAGSAPLTGTIPPDGSATIRTAGLGGQTVGGWAELTAPATVGGSIIYSQKTALPSVQEGTATIVASGSKHFFLPFDNTAGGATGVAITNPGAIPPSTISVTYRYSDGTSEVSTLAALPSRNHVAFALSTPGKQGVAEVTSDAPLFTVVFRANSTGALTSLGVVPGP